MNVLLATDGSPEDRPARHFVAGAHWPAGSQIELFGVIRTSPLALSGDPIERNARDFERELEFLATSLPARDCVVTWRYAVGQPAETIAIRAEAMPADLIVVGSRGRGAIAAAVLGSVSTGVIDRAPCPVLVSRRCEIRRIVVAADGSAGAAAAAEFVNEWPMFDGAVLHVVNPSVREGDAAEQILAAAREFAADLIVVGSHDQRGLGRPVARSLARRVAVGATCSVLIARGSAEQVRAHDHTSPAVVFVAA